MAIRRRAALHTSAVLAAGALTVAAAPAAFASEAWCDVDPVQIIITSGGALVPVFVTNGARSLGNVAQLLLARITHTTQSVDGGKATLVTMKVTVPNGLLGKRFETHSVVTSGPLGLLTEYASTSGMSGEAMTMQFKLPVG